MQNLTPQKNKNSIIWTVIALIFIVVGTIILLLEKSKCEALGIPIFCGFNSIFSLVPLISIGIFILLIKAVKHFTKNK